MIRRSKFSRYFMRKYEIFHRRSAKSPSQNLLHAFQLRKSLLLSLILNHMQRRRELVCSSCVGRGSRDRSPSSADSLFFFPPKTVVQTVKEIVQELADDGELLFDKIGVTTFYWSFPSQVANSVRVNLGSWRYDFLRLTRHYHG